MRRVILDIGTHKTGTTSRQEFLRNHRRALNARGIEVYEGSIIPSNHVELHMACMADERMSPIKLQQGGNFDRRALYEQTAKRIGRYLERSDWSTLVFSAEGLSYLVHKEELERLAALFSGVTVDVVVYLREKADFLRSYAGQMAKMGIPLSDDRASFAYAGEDSWLVDYDRFAAFGSRFASLTTHSYADAVAAHGSVVPHFLSEVLRTDLSGEAQGGYWLNTSAAAGGGRLRRWLGAALRG